MAKLRDSSSNPLIDTLDQNGRAEEFDRIATEEEVRFFFFNSFKCKIL